MRILLSAIPEPGEKGEWRQAKDGTSLHCLGHHFNGAGLLEIGHLIESEGLMRVFRLTMTGEPLCIVERDALGEDHPVFDRDTGLGDAEKAETESIEMMQTLGGTLTPEEENAYYL